MFDFRLINMPDGNQIIDRSLKTSYEALTPLQMIEYIEMDVELYILDKLEEKQRREAEQQRKCARNPFYKLACMCGIM